MRMLHFTSSIKNKFLKSSSGVDVLGKCSTFSCGFSDSWCLWRLMLRPQCEKSGLWVSSVPNPHRPRWTVGSRKINISTRIALDSCFFLNQPVSLRSRPFIFSPVRNLRVLWSLLPAWEKECCFSLRRAGQLAPGCFCLLFWYPTRFNAELCCHSILSVLVQ